MKKYISRITIAVTLMFTVLFSGMALAIDCTTCSGDTTLNTQQAIECGTSCASGNNQTPAQASSKLDDTIREVINVLSVAVGLVAIIMIIIGGFRYVTSGGKQESVASAKNTILYAVIGLVIVALAQVIVRFVLFHTINTGTPHKVTKTSSANSSSVRASGA